MGIRNDVTNLANSVTNAANGSPFGNYGANDPTKYTVFQNDFLAYAAGDWVVAETDAAATQALTAGDGGLLLITNTGALNDLVGLQWAGGSGAVAPQFVFDPNKRLFIEGRFAVDDATNAIVALGLYVLDTSPIASAPTDGIYLLKAAGGTSFVGRVGAASSYAVSSSFGTLVAATQASVALAYNGIPDVSITGAITYAFDVFFNGTQAGSVVAAAANLPSAALAVSFALQNATAAVRTMTIDRLVVIKER